MGTSVLIVAIAIGGAGALIPGSEVEKQDKTFQRFWDTDFVWKFDELPEKAVVPGYRVPYSGYIYPDTRGGTSSALRKYDRAFNYGRSSATSHEQWDTTAFKEREPRRGLLGRIGMSSMQTPHWHGHCNGWAAAAIRHAEPETSVRFNGVTFTPADIKALLAEIYLYNDTITLTKPERPLNPGTFHALITNWVGRGRHPIGMEEDPTEEKWNYPIYAYASTSAKRGDHSVEVKMNIAYAKDSNGEYQESPRIQKIKYFHYSLTIDDNGNIVGGRFYRDSSNIDFLWIPLRPKPSRTPGHERGNPYVNVDRVLAIWRASVEEDVRKKWPIIDPPKAERILDIASIEGLVPVQDPDASRSDPTASETEVADSEDAAAEDADSETAGSEASDADVDDAQPQIDAPEVADSETDELEADVFEVADPETVDSVADAVQDTDSETPATEVVESEAEVAEPESAGGDPDSADAEDAALVADNLDSADATTTE